MDEVPMPYWMHSWMRCSCHGEQHQEWRAQSFEVNWKINLEQTQNMGKAFSPWFKVHYGSHSIKKNLPDFFSSSALNMYSFALLAIPGNFDPPRAALSKAWAASWKAICVHETSCHSQCLPRSKVFFNLVSSESAWPTENADQIQTTS